MLLYVFVDGKLDPTWGVFIVGGVITVAVGIIRWYIKGVKQEIITNRNATTNAALAIKTELTAEIATKKTENEQAHVQTRKEFETRIESVVNIINDHIKDDRIQFADGREEFRTVKASLEALNKDTSESKGMLHVLVKDAKITFDK